MTEYTKITINCLILNCKSINNLTQIHQKSKISYPTILKYFEMLKNKRMVSEVKIKGDRARYFLANKKGLKFLKDYDAREFN